MAYSRYAHPRILREIRVVNIALGAPTPSRDSSDVRPEQRTSDSTFPTNRLCATTRNLSHPAKSPSSSTAPSPSSCSSSAASGVCKSATRKSTTSAPRPTASSRPRSSRRAAAFSIATAASSSITTHPSSCWSARDVAQGRAPQVAHRRRPRAMEYDDLIGQGASASRARAPNTSPWCQSRRS